jgi:hypothetical protein
VERAGAPAASGKKAGRPPKWARRQLIDGIRWRTRTGSGTARAHQHAAGARKNGAAQEEPPGGVCAPEPADHALGRSRGGLTSKFHLACEQGQKPLAVIVTAGHRHESPQFTVVLMAPTPHFLNTP